MLLLVVEHVGRQLVLPATLALFICERVAGLVDGTRRSTAGCLVSAGSRAFLRSEGEASEILQALGDRRRREVILLDSTWQDARRNRLIGLSALLHFQHTLLVIANYQVHLGVVPDLLRRLHMISRIRIQVSAFQEVARQLALLGHYVELLLEVLRGLCDPGRIAHSSCLAQGAGCHAVIMLS